MLIAEEERICLGMCWHKKVELFFGFPLPYRLEGFFFWKRFYLLTVHDL